MEIIVRSMLNVYPEHVLAVSVLRGIRRMAEVVLQISNVYPLCVMPACAWRLDFRTVSRVLLMRSVLRAIVWLESAAEIVNLGINVRREMAVSADCVFRGMAAIVKMALIAEREWGVSFHETNNK